MLRISNFSKRQWLTLIVFSIADFCNAICVSLQAPFYPQEVRGPHLISNIIWFIELGSSCHVYVGLCNVGGREGQYILVVNDSLGLI